MSIGRALAPEATVEHEGVLLSHIHQSRNEAVGFDRTIGWVKYLHTYLHTYIHHVFVFVLVVKGCRRFNLNFFFFFLLSLMSIKKSSNAPPPVFVCLPQEVKLAEREMEIERKSK